MSSFSKTIPGMCMQYMYKIYPLFLYVDYENMLQWLLWGVNIPPLSSIKSI